jgi:hypothetical protein
LIGKYKWTKLDGQHGSKYEVYNEVAVEEAGSKNLDWINVARYSFQERVFVNRVIQLMDPQKEVHFLIISTTLSF